jgi:hypothetical protein
MTKEITQRESAMDIDGWIKEDRVHRRVYVDPAVFAREMESIFERTWVFWETILLYPVQYVSAGMNPVPTLSNLPTPFDSRHSWNGVNVPNFPEGKCPNPEPLFTLYPIRCHSSACVSGPKPRT